MVATMAEACRDTVGGRNQVGSEMVDEVLA
jgi:hypothetical protein